MNKSIALTVNQKPVRASVEPRTHLADFLRGDIGLTGTHIGCEQGVCGACTVIIDGKPMRSCITYAVACEGTDIVTIEGLEDDDIANDLREAFSAHHGLQCGFCTPGMLVVARDLIIRRGECSEVAIREELSGNLCRCTGYMGIVAAVKAASAGRAPRPASEKVEFKSVRASVPAAQPSAPRRAAPVSSGVAVGKEGWTELSQQISVAADAEATWDFLKDIPRVARCLPGAELESFEGSGIRGRMVVKFGPIRASFAGEGAVTLDEENRTGVLRGAGRDTGSGSQASGEVTYKVVDTGANACAIDIALRYRITGMLAQFSRGGLVRDLVARLTESFAQNLAASIGGGEANAEVAPISAFSLFASVFLERLKKIFR